MNETAATVKKVSRVTLTEDWVSVVLGFAIILVFLGGIIILAPSYSWKNFEELTGKVLTISNASRAFFQLVFVVAIGGLGAVLTGKPLRSTLISLVIIYILSVIALVIAGNKLAKDLNLEAVIFSLTIGLIIGNFFEIPDWLRKVLSAEFFVKIGLVLLGTGVIFADILKAGSLGLIQALLVVISVWYFAFWLCKRLKLDEELSMMISSAVSICGVSAAIATAGAIKGDQKKLSYVISLVLVTAIPMMVLMPFVAKHLGLTEEVTGAWLGGTIDTTGAVVAAGSLVGETALNYSTIVKFSQNVLLGIAALAISIYWSYRGQGAEKVERPSLAVLWERFPKFVLGFIAASLIFSFVLDPATIAPMKDGLKAVQTLWFVMAFTTIGLETRFKDLFNAGNTKPLYAFLAAQGFNVIVTLLIAWVLFR
jgi:uncharacterized integral membrane protein (TIGR00698 family)